MAKTADPEAFGDKQQITVDVHHHLGDSLSRAERREIELNPVAESTNAQSGEQSNTQNTGDVDSDSE